MTHDEHERRSVVRDSLGVGLATGVYGASFGALGASGGLSVLQALFHLLSIETMEMATGGLRHGLIADLIGNTGYTGDLGSPAWSVLLVNNGELRRGFLKTLGALGAAGFWFGAFSN